MLGLESMVYLIGVHVALSSATCLEDDQWEVVD